MKEYLKMSDMFKGELSIDCDCDDVIVDELSLTVLESFGGSDLAKYALHAINSHDELVENYLLASKERDEWEARAYKEGSNAHNLQVRVDALSDLIERAAYIFYLSGSTSRDESLNPIEQWLFDAEKNKGA